jgi:hypothetical protein
MWSWQGGEDMTSPDKPFLVQLYVQPFRYRAWLLLVPATLPTQHTCLGTLSTHSCNAEEVVSCDDWKCHSQQQLYQRCKATAPVPHRTAGAAATPAAGGTSAGR